MSYLYSFVVYLYVNGGGSIASVGGGGGWFVCCCLPVVVWFLFGEVPIPLGAWVGCVVLLWCSLGLLCGWFSKYMTLL